MVLDASLLNTQHYKAWVNPGKGVAPSPTPWCSSSWKESLWVTLDYSRQLYLLTYSLGYIYEVWFWLNKPWLQLNEKEIKNTSL